MKRILGLKKITVWMLIFSSLYSCQRDKGSNGNVTITYCENIEPLISKHCVVCHSKGGIAPFSLATYQQVARRASAISYVVESRYMPPWKPDPHYSSFEGERYLSEAEIDLIKQWYAQGTVYSKPGSACAPAAQKTQIRSIGDPDISFNPKENVIVPPDENDYYCNYIFSNVSDTDVSIAAIRFTPGVAKVTHHAWLFIDTTGQFRANNKSANLLSTEKNEFHFSAQKELMNDFLIYTPGMFESFFPDEVGYRLPAHADLIVQVHYFSVLSEQQTGQFKLGLFLSKAVPQKFVQRMMLTEQNLDRPLYIAANTRQTFVLASKPIPAPMKVYRIAPHMHYRGLSYKAFAVSLKNDTIPLIKINDWDLMWQGIYKYRQPVLIPKGAIIKVVAEIDNRNNNVHNPVIPAVDAKFGYRAVDEMLEMMLEYTDP